MNRWFVLAVVWLMVVTQVTVLAAIRPFGVVPQLLLVALLFVAAFRSLSLTLVSAVWGAWWLTVFAPLPMNTWLLLYPLAAILMYAIERLGIETTKVSGMVMTLVATIISINVLAVIFMSISRGEMLLAWQLLVIIAIESIAAVVLAWVLRPLLQSVIRPVN